MTLVEPVGGGSFAAWASSSATRPAGRLYSAARTATRRERRHRLVAQRLVHELRAPPSTSRSTPASCPSRQRLRQRLRGDAASACRAHAIHSAPARTDSIAARAPRRPRPGSAARLGARCLLHALDELAGLGRVERAGRVVDEHARRAESASCCAARAAPPSRLSARGCARARPRALPARGSRPQPREGWRGRSVGRMRKTSMPLPAAVAAEAAHEVPRHGAPADEKPAAERHPERRRAARGSSGCAPRGSPPRAARRYRSSRRPTPRGRRSPPCPARRQAS